MLAAIRVIKGRQHPPPTHLTSNPYSPKPDLPFHLSKSAHGSSAVTYFCCPSPLHIDFSRKLLSLSPSKVISELQMQKATSQRKAMRLLRPPALSLEIGNISTGELRLCPGLMGYQPRIPELSTSVAPQKIRELFCSTAH